MIEKHLAKIERLPIHSVYQNYMEAMDARLSAETDGPTFNSTYWNSVAKNTLDIFFTKVELIIMDRLSAAPETAADLAFDFRKLLREP